ncbi:putative bifunctional diguanylate cyclase/phosphodiesterase [Roseibium sp. M-1]
MANFLADVPVPILLFCLAAAVALLVIGFVGGRAWSSRTGKDTVSGFGNDTAILKLVVEHAHEGLVMQDIYGHIEWTNPAYTRITGYTADEIRGRRPQEFILTPENQLPPEDIANFRFDLTKIPSGTDELILNRRKNGELFWNQLTFAVVEGKTEEDAKIILICRDVTSQVEHVKELEEARNRLKHQAEHDDLTGVANRAKLSAYLQEHLAGVREGSGRIGVILFDLDHFKDINDSYGHGAGDAVLRHAAAAMTAVIGKDGLVARIGGDEFIAVVADPTSPDQMEAIGKRLLEGLEKPLRIDHRNLKVAGSVGLVLADTSRVSASELINRADIALYTAKRSGRSQISWYTDALGAAHRHRRMSLAQLDSDLENGNLRLLMQPHYSLEQRQITGYEVTARWLHPSEGLVDPVTMLSELDDLKRIAQIERFALSRGMAEVKRLRDASNAPFFMSVNLTGASLKEPDFLGMLTQLCEDNRFELEDIVIELDEKIIRFDEPDGLLDMVEKLSGVGCKVALDKFGSGHGGAGQLVYLNADKLKLCPDLVAGLEDMENRRQLVRSVIRLAGNLGLETSAAGVDTTAQMDLLKEFGCTGIQGEVIAGLLSPREAEIHMREFELMAELP